MLVVMKPTASQEATERVCSEIRNLGFVPHPMPGAGRTAIGITGNHGPVNPLPIESLEGVDQCIPVVFPAIAVHLFPAFKNLDPIAKPFEFHGMLLSIAIPLSSSLCLNPISPPPSDHAAAGRIFPGPAAISAPQDCT